MTVRILQILESIPGVVRAAALTEGQRRRAIEQEARHERSSILPVRNVGVRLLADRDVCLAVLKDGTFRSPRVPTVYLVEEGAREDAPHVLTVEGQRYAVVGEEVVAGHRPYTEPTIPLEDSFVIFPERRSGADVPCLFLLPPIAFPELEREQTRLGIGQVVSISPSLAADVYIRDTFGFPSTNELATLLIGCNRHRAEAPMHSRSPLDF